MVSLLILLNIGLIVWLLVITYFYQKQQRLFTEITTDVSKHDLKTLLQKISQNQNVLAKHSKEVESLLQTHIRSAKLHFQKIGFLRFNPYSDTGGNQSFSLCLLDQDNQGVIITSLHGRDQTRIYAKPIIDGQSQEDFFEEEKIVLNKAINYSSS